MKPLVVAVAVAAVIALGACTTSTPAPTTSANQPTSGWQDWTKTILADLKAVGRETPVNGFGTRSDYLCNHLTADVEAAGTEDGWTPHTGKTATGLDGTYVEMLNQVHQAAAGCLNHNDAEMAAHLDPATPALKKLLASF